MSLSFGSVKRVSDAVVPCVPWPTATVVPTPLLNERFGPRASMPRVLVTKMLLPTVATSAG